MKTNPPILNLIPQHEHFFFFFKSLQCGLCDLKMMARSLRTSMLLAQAGAAHSPALGMVAAEEGDLQPELLRGAVGTS